MFGSQAMPSQDNVDRRLLSEVIWKARVARDAAAVDVELFSRRLEVEEQNAGSLRFRFEMTSDPCVGRQLTTCCQHLGYIRFAHKSALAAVERADTLIARVRRRIGEISHRVDGKAA